MNKQCTQCNKSFKILDQDREFYAAMQVPEPTQCSACRMQRRLAWRNERNFYNDKCASCKRAIVSQFSPEERLVVYCEVCYWSDTWAGQDYGRDFDFSLTFTEQFDALNRAVPHMAMIHTESENCEYTHLAANNKNCYMIIESSHNEECSYSYWIQRSNRCVDTSYTDGGQLLYETDNATRCYRVFYSQNVRDCMDSYFLRNCRDVKNSFGCVNLANKQYYIFNKQHTQNEYERYIDKLQLHTWSGVQEAKSLFNEFLTRQTHKYAEIIASEQVTGNYLHHANNCTEVFHGYDVENAAYAEHVWREAKDVMDVSTVGINAELVYDSINCALDVYNVRFSNQCWQGCSAVDYSMYCGGLKKGFGCAAIKSGNNLILNKEYTETEYDVQVKKIIEHMSASGEKEWGQFIDPKYSPFGYNESVAQQNFPTEKSAAEALGFKWRDTLPFTIGRETIEDIPDDINVTSDSITKEVLACENCERNYRITEHELQMYKELAVPVPHECPDCRHQKRISMRNPNQLWHRQCMCTRPPRFAGDAGAAQPDHSHTGRCSTEFETTYSPERKELVYCERCYQQEVV